MWNRYKQLWVSSAAALVLLSNGCWAAVGSSAISPVLPRAATPLKTLELGLSNERRLTFGEIADVAVGDLISLVYQGESCTQCNSLREDSDDEAEGPEGGYCATIAVIKASMAVFGVTGIFAKLDTTDDGGMVAMLRDDRELRLTRDELEFAFDPKKGIVPGWCGQRSCDAQSKNRSKEAKALRDWITLYFAFAAKSLQASDVPPESCREGIGGYARAFKAISNGFTNQEAFVLLGVQNHTFDDPDLDKDTAIIWTPGHVMFSTGGAVDRWGRPRKKRWFAVVKSVGISSFVQPRPSVEQLSGGWDPFQVGREDNSICM